MNNLPILYSRIEGSGHPLLILHGYLGMSDNWKTLATQYANKGFMVHTLDLRNHGRSFHSDAFSYQDMAEDLINYCQFHGLYKISLIGHSMGGKLAMYFTMAFPERIDKLVIADISPRAYAPHHQDILKALNTVDFSIQKTRKEVEDVLTYYISDFGVRQFLMKNVYRKTADSLDFRMNLKTLTEKYDNIGIALPLDTVFDKDVLFLRGEKSGYITQQDELDIRFHFPKASIITIKNSGHWLHAENPDDFFSYSLNYLKR